LAQLTADWLRAPENFERARKQVMNALRAHFKPEFLNRVDDFIIFNPLGTEELTKIIDLRLEEVRRLLTERQISLELTDTAKDLLLHEGYDPDFGARPLKRSIQRLVQDPLAVKILHDEVLPGDRVVVDAEQGKMKFVASRRGAEQPESPPDFGNRSKRPQETQKSDLETE